MNKPLRVAFLSMSILSLSFQLTADIMQKLGTCFCKSRPAVTYRLLTHQDCDQMCDKHGTWTPY